jgi:4'-phosphopantetheinyl transferase-like protein
MMHTAVFACRDLEISRTGLTAAERDQLDRSAFCAARAREWTAGRVAAHRALAAHVAPGCELSVLGDASGAPHVAGADLGISISHDGAWVAVAVGDGRVAIDLCARQHDARLVRILDRLGVASDAPPAVAWAALECALKLRRRGVWSLLDADLAIDLATDLAIDREARVIGVGPPARVAWTQTGEYALAWAEEPR